MGTKTWIVYYIVIFIEVAVAQDEDVTQKIMYINEASNDIAEETLEVVIEYLKKNPSIKIPPDNIQKLTVNGTDAEAVLKKICSAYGKLLEENTPPILVLDTTLTGVPSETVKSFTSALGIPTVSTSYGQENDIRSWRNLDESEVRYLVQIMPPADIMAEVVRSLVVKLQITSASILFDDSFIMDHKYKSLLQNIPVRHLITAVDGQDIKAQLTKMKELDVVNFFILGRLSTIKYVLDAATELKYFGKMYAWFAITQDKGALQCDCDNATVMFLYPEADPDSRERLGKLQSTYRLNGQPEIAAAFYFDVIMKALQSAKDLPPIGKYVTCEEFDSDDRPKRDKVDILTNLKQDIPANYAPIKITKNGESSMEFTMRIQKVNIVASKSTGNPEIGTWKAQLDSSGGQQNLQIKNENDIKNFTAKTFYKISVVEQKPFIFKNPDLEQRNSTPFVGYCIDLINEIQTLIDFDYEAKLAPENKFGSMDEKGDWDGMIKQLIDKDADIGLGSLSVMAERENVIDFTVPYYDLVGITILMKKSKTPTSLFKFLTVLETDVWLCILAAYFFTSFLMWVFDRWSPYSYQNNREKYKDDEEKREFHLKECLWFCMTSLTPQGGGEAPKNLSGRLVAATWWLFGFIIIASYTANLAAFLTVSRLDTPVESLDDLSKQYKIQYAPINGSSAMTYFQRMADIETRFYEIWKDMSLNDSLSEVERAKLAVWDYPVSDKYTKMWQAMKEARLPKDQEEALQRVIESPSSSEGFAYIGDATDIRYQVLTNCDYQMVGEEFSRKPYAIAVQQGSPLKDQFNNAILQLLNKRKLEKLKETWWTNNKAKAICEKQTEETDGISIQNIGGVFIVIFVGIGMACITLAFEYWWYRGKRNPKIIVKSKPAEQAKAAFGKQTNLEQYEGNLYPERFNRRDPALTSVEQPW